MHMRAPRCPSRLTTLQVGFGGMCIYTLRQKGIRREYCGVRGANVEEVGATDIEETKLQTPVLRIYEVSVAPCPQMRPSTPAPCSTRRRAVYCRRFKRILTLDLLRIQARRSSRLPDDGPADAHGWPPWPLAPALGR